MDWTPPPEPLTWTLPVPLSFGSASYATITLRSPSAGDVLKASAIPGTSSLGVTLRLIAEISAERVPYEALTRPGGDGLPAYLVEQMGNYLDMFGGAPLPDPLEAWRAELSAKREAAAKAKTEAGSAAT